MMHDEWYNPYENLSIPGGPGRIQCDVHEAGIRNAPASMPEAGLGSTTVHFYQKTGTLLIDCKQNGVDFGIVDKALKYYGDRNEEDVVKNVVLLITPRVMRDEGAVLCAQGYERCGDQDLNGRYHWQRLVPQKKAQAA